METNELILIKETGFFEDNPGNKSGTRLVTIIGGLVVTGLLVFLTLWDTLKNNMANIMTIVAYYGTAMGVLATWKISQKVLEVNQAKAQIEANKIVDLNQTAAG